MFDPHSDLRVHDKVDSIGKAIDTLTNDVCFTYAWFKTNEITKRTPYKSMYVTVHEDGKLLGFAPCFISTNGDLFWFGPHSFQHLKRFFNVGKKLKLWKKDFLLCYAPNCCRTKISVEETSDKNKIFEKLIIKIDDVCKQEKILFSFFPFVSEFDKPLLFSLETLGYHKLFYKDTHYLDVDWSSFEDYLKSLKYHSRKTIRRDIRNFEKNGIIIELLDDFKDISTTLSDLYSNLFSKYQKNEKSSLTNFYYETLNDCAQDKAQVFIAKKNGIIVGFSISLRHGDVLDMFQCGFDYDLIEKTDGIYFNLTYYEPIKWAINKGIRKIYYRTSADDAKRRRGCKTEKVHSFVKCHNKFLDFQIGTYSKTLKDHDCKG